MKLRLPMPMLITFFISGTMVEGVRLYPFRRKDIQNFEYIVSQGSKNFQIIFAAGAVHISKNMCKFACRGAREAFISCFQPEIRTEASPRVTEVNETEKR